MSGSGQLVKGDHWLCAVVRLTRINIARFPGLIEEPAVLHVKAFRFRAADEIKSMLPTTSGVDGETRLRAFMPMVINVANPDVAVHCLASDVAVRRVEVFEE